MKPYTALRVGPPVCWSLGGDLPCPGSDHHQCPPCLASS